MSTDINARIPPPLPFEKFPLNSHQLNVAQIIWFEAIQRVAAVNFFEVLKQEDNGRKTHLFFRLFPNIIFNGKQGGGQIRINWEVFF